MSIRRLAGLLLLLAGILAVAFGGFSYTKETHQANIGPVQVAVKEKGHVNIPLWAGVGGIVLGGLLLAVRTREA
jgi:hypothetical protein